MGGARFADYGGDGRRRYGFCGGSIGLAGNGNLVEDGWFVYVYDHLDRLTEVYVYTYPAGATMSTGLRSVPCS